jgi:hypothetical protein
MNLLGSLRQLVDDKVAHSKEPIISRTSRIIQRHGERIYRYSIRVP